MNQETKPASGGLRGRRLAIIGAVVTLTVGLSGFFMGIRQTERSVEGTREAWTAKSEAKDELQTYPAALTYKQMAGGPLHANRQWTLSLATLARQEAAARFTPAVLTEVEGQALRLRRVTRRAYDGAPPVAPHPIDQRNPAACLECHGRATRIGNIDTPQISHPAYTNCIQCHVSSLGPANWWQTRNDSLSEGNQFQGKPLSGQGKRAYVGAPPTIPHTTWMRDDCMSCHGPGGSVAMRTSHPNRQSCTQCHAPDAQLDQRLAAGLPPPLPVADWKTQATVKQ